MATRPLHRMSTTPEDSPSARIHPGADAYAEAPGSRRMSPVEPAAFPSARLRPCDKSADLVRLGRASALRPTRYGRPAPALGCLIKAFDYCVRKVGIGWVASLK